MNEKSSYVVELAPMAASPEQARSSMGMSLPVMTFNLHRDQPTDGSNSWEHRRDLCTTLINKFAPLIVCTQEGLKSQLEDLANALSGYEQFGVSRKGPGDPSEEHCAILYARDKVEKMDGGTFWLSKSPEVPDSKSWKAKNPSIATWVTFQLKGVQQPGFAFQVLSTHLDRHSSRARRRGALLIWQHIATLPQSLPVILCGTFNTLKESFPARFLFGLSRDHGVTGDLRDGWAAARQHRNAAILYTQHDFKGERRGATEMLKLFFMALCLCWDRQNQDFHVDWILFRGRALSSAYCEIVDYNVDVVCNKVQSFIKLRHENAMPNGPCDRTRVKQHYFDFEWNFYKLERKNSLSCKTALVATREKDEKSREGYRPLMTINDVLEIS